VESVSNASNLRCNSGLSSNNLPRRNWTGFVMGSHDMEYSAVEDFKCPTCRDVHRRYYGRQFPPMIFVDIQDGSRWERYSELDAGKVKLRLLTEGKFRRDEQLIEVAPETFQLIYEPEIEND
jgi:hypothetical protein